jgi:hypothetical protein
MSGLILTEAKSGMLAVRGQGPPPTYWPRGLHIGKSGPAPDGAKTTTVVEGYL